LPLTKNWTGCGRNDHVLFEFITPEYVCIDWKNKDRSQLSSGDSRPTYPYYLPEVQTTTPRSFSLRWGRKWYEWPFAASNDMWHVDWYHTRGRSHGIFYWLTLQLTGCRNPRRFRRLNTKPNTVLW
jgi:hypothetical protein